MIEFMPLVVTLNNSIDCFNKIEHLEMLFFMPLMLDVSKYKFSY
jgi:hypothetical protein